MSTEFKLVVGRNSKDPSTIAEELIYDHVLSQDEMREVRSELEKRHAALVVIDQVAPVGYLGPFHDVRIGESVIVRAGDKPMFVDPQDLGTEKPPMVWTADSLMKTHKDGDPVGEWKPVAGFALWKWKIGLWWSKIRNRN